MDRPAQRCGLVRIGVAVGLSGLSLGVFLFLARELLAVIWVGVTDPGLLHDRCATPLVMLAAERVPFLTGCSAAVAALGLLMLWFEFARGRSR